MADVNANIGVNIDTSNALAQLKALQRQISQFHTSIARSSETAGLAQRDLQKNFLNSINAVGSFSAELRTVKTTAESFTDSLEKNKFSMREYFRFAGASTKTFGKLFSSEFDTINKVAEQNVKRLQTQYVKMGRDASGAMRAIAIMPNELDMSKMSTQLQMAAQRQSLFNQLVKQGSTNLLNFGKNTQWAGRQLMVGFTLPLATLGMTASKTFMDMETAAIKFRKVYGDLFTPEAERQQALADIEALGQSFTRYGIAVSQTVSLAADAAAAGFQGLDLQRQVTEATRLQILGQLDQQKALETTISLQNSFQLQSEELAEAINFLNAVENQTVVSLDDITTAIPKAAPVVKQLGGDVKDLAFFLTAMKEGGINASEGANALKSGLASLINPTDKARDMMKGFGIDIDSIVNKNAGNVKQTVIEFATALDSLTDLNRQRAIEQLFGKFQLARLSTLFQNVIQDGNQASRVIDLTTASTEELARMAESELGMTADSGMTKFRKSVEDLKFALIPVGEAFLQAVTPILEFVGGVLERFDNLSSGVKKAIVVLTVAIGAIGPVALMTFGLLMNALANGAKGLLVLRQGYLRLTGQTQILGEQTDYLTVEQQRAAAVAHSLDQSHARLTQTFNAEAGAIRNLANEYRNALAALQQFAQRNPGMMMPPKKYNKGVVVVPGSGNKDTVPAMLTPGEAVIPADMTQKYGALINGMIAGNIPGYMSGKAASYAHAQMPFLPGSAQYAKGIQIAGLEKLAAEFPQFIKVVSNLVAELPQALNVAMKTGASAESFTAEYGARTGKFKTAAKLGGLDLLNVENTAALQSLENEIGERTVQLAKQQAVGDEIIVTDQIFADATRAVIDKYKAVEGAAGKAANALDIASQQIGQIRVSAKKQDIVAGLQSGQFTRSKTGRQTQNQILFDNINVGRESSTNPNNFYSGNPITPSGSYKGKKKQAVLEATQLGDEVVTATARAAGTQSPSKRTIPIGEDIARGLEVGMQNRADDVANVGASVAAGATRAMGRGVRTTGPITPGTDFPIEKTRGGVSIPQVANAAIISESTKKSADTMVASAKSFQDRMTGLNRGIMSGTFALGSLSGLASMSGGKLGEFAGTVSKLNLAMFALMSVTQMLTQTQFLKLASDRASAAGLLVGNVATKKMAFNSTLFAGGIKKLLPNLFNFGKVIARFLGPIGLAITAIGATVSIIKTVNAARERERLSIEGLGDAALLTKDKLKTLGDIFGVVPQTTALERTGPSLVVNREERTKIDELRSNEDFLKQFENDIKALRQATSKEAELIFNSLAIQLKGKGFAKEQITNIIQALQEESGKIDLKFDFANIDLGTDQGQETLKKNIADLGSSLGKDFSTGYTEETQSGINRATGEIVTWTKQTLSKDLKKTVSTVSKSIVGILNGISGQLETGTITAKQFDQSFGNISKTVSNMPKPQAALLMGEVFKNLPGELAKSAAGLKNTSNQLLLVEAAMLGVTTITPAMIAALKMAEESLDGGAQRAASRVRRRIKEEIASLKEIRELVAKELGGEGTGGGGGEKSVYQKAIEELKEQRKQLIQSQDAFAKLKKAGVETGRAFEIASNPILAAAIATTKVGTPQWKELLKLIKDVNRELLSSELLKFFEGRTAELNLKKQFAEILPLLEGMGLKSEDIKAIFSDPDLARAFIKDLQDGVLNSKELAKYIKQIPEMKKIDIVLGFSEDDVEAELQRKADELFSYLERAAEREYQPLILDAEKEVENAQKAVDGVQAEIDKIERNVESLQRKTEINISRKIEEFQEQVSDLQRSIELNFERPIEELNKQINSIEKTIESSFDTPIASLQAEIEKMQRSIEMGFERPIAALQEEASDLSNELELMDRAAQQINDKYDAQEEALSKISEINQEISAQQKSQLSIADALTQGDISAAAQAAQEARAQAAAAASERASGTLGAARQAQLEALRTRQGMTRVQVEQRQFAISQQVFNLEEDREEVQARILVKQDAIYNLEQSRIPLQEQIRIKQTQIAEKQLQQELIQKNIRDIEDQIYNLEEDREKNLFEIRGLEDEVYNIKNGSLLTAQNELKTAQDDLKVLQDKLKARLDDVKLQREAWQFVADEEIRSQVELGKYNTILDATKEKLKLLLDYWTKIRAAMAGASGSTGVTGSTNVTGSTSVAVSTPEQDAAAKAAAEAADAAAAAAAALAAEAEAAAAAAAAAAADAASVNSAITAISTAQTTKDINKAVQVAVLVGESASNIANAMMTGLVAQGVDTANAASTARYTGMAIQYQQQQQAATQAATNAAYETSNRLRSKFANAGGLMKKYYAKGGPSLGSDIVPAMLTPGEFVMSKYAVKNFGVDNMKAVNDGTYSGESVYNYSINVNVKSGANPDEIARSVMTQIKQIDSQRIRGQRV